MLCCEAFSRGRAEAFPAQMGLKPTSRRPQGMMLKQASHTKRQGAQSRPCPSSGESLVISSHPLSASLLPTTHHFILWWGPGRGTGATPPTMASPFVPGSAGCVFLCSFLWSASQPRDVPATDEAKSLLYVILQAVCANAYHCAWHVAFTPKHCLFLVLLCEPGRQLRFASSHSEAFLIGNMGFGI